MLPNLADIKRLRKKYNLSQKDLAKNSGVSQSLIAKVESGKIEPTYSKIVKIFNSLEKLQKNNEKKAKDLVNKKIIFAESFQKLSEIVDLMKKNGISQLPVRSNSMVVGIVNERIVLQAIIDNKDNFSSLTVSDVMGDSPPIVSEKTRQSILLELLRTEAMVLISQKGRILGIVTKADLMSNI